MAENRHIKGVAGEDNAAEYITRQGYEIIERNHRVGRYGEIDIIARENGVLCFIEVKLRKTDLFGLPSEAVNIKKIRKIRNIALLYISAKELNDIPVRFDVIEITFEKGEASINHIKNAF